MIEYTVQQGDCLASIAEAHGFFWQTLWNLPENAELKRRHPDPTILLPGEIVRIPDLRRNVVSGATEKKHQFVKKGTPAILRLRIMRAVPPEPPQQQADTSDSEPPADEPLEVTEEDSPPAAADAEEPWADAPYVLRVDGRTQTGQTDGAGKLEVKIPPGAREGKLTVEAGTNRERVFVLKLGYLDPMSAVSGIAGRLTNLGFYNGQSLDEMTPELQDALRRFQKANGLIESGEADQATQDKLRELHGS